MRVIALVYDKRCDKGISTRGKDFTNIKDGLEWARNLKNKCTKWVTILDNGRAYSTACE